MGAKSEDNCHSERIQNIKHKVADTYETAVDLVTLEQGFYTCGKRTLTQTLSGGTRQTTLLSDL